MLTSLIHGRISDALGHRRVYPVRAPQDVVAPYVVFTVQEGPEAPGSLGFANYRVQVDCFSFLLDEAWEVARVAGQAVRMWQDRSGPLAVLNALDGKATDGWADEAGVYRVAFDFVMWCYEEVG